VKGRGSGDEGRARGKTVCEIAPNADRSGRDEGRCGGSLEAAKSGILFGNFVFLGLRSNSGIR
jgi:hypothetical protein